MNILDTRENLNAMVLKHEQQIKDLAAHLLELKQFTAMFKPGLSLTQGGVAPTMEFSTTEQGRKCAVNNCENHAGQGMFYGFLCSPCHRFVSGDGGLHSQAERNQQAMVDAAVEMERKKKEWVGLTEQEKYVCYLKIDVWSRCVESVEAKLREKNGG